MNLIKAAKSTELTAFMCCTMGTVLWGDLATFTAQLEHDLQGRSVGYGYAVYENGVEVSRGGGGVAVLGDPENQFDAGTAFTADTVKDVHSMSKTVTAVAMLMALDSRDDLSLASSIFPFLPADFQQWVPVGSPIRQITFQQLLGHRSGFGASSSFSWQQMRTQLQGGLANDLGDYEYSNWNYAACRLLIPYVLATDFFRQFEAQAAGESDNGVAQLSAFTADFYINYVRNEVFTPAGLGMINPGPVDATAANFALYYNFRDLSIPASLMPNRRLTVGSGGWAMSAAQYAQFIDALFDGAIIGTDRLEVLVNNNLGIFRGTGANGVDVYPNHSGATGSTVGGRSCWMYFPNDLAVAIQVNSVQNQYQGVGLDLARILQEAWENAFGTVAASSLNYPLHLFFSRAEDGWITSRGVQASARPAARNFDYDFPKNAAPAGFDHHVFTAVGSQAFLVRYDGDHPSSFGQAVIHQINSDGTLGAETYASSNWLAGWTHVRAFQTSQGTFLLLHNHTSGRVRTIPLSSQGTVLSAVSDLNLTAGFDVAETFVLGGQHQFLRSDSSTGEVVARQLNADGSIGAITYSAQWAGDFNDWEFFTAGGNLFVFRYDTSTGAARINRIDGTLATTPQILDDGWAANWTTLRFFEIQNQSYFIRYNKFSGLTRVQEINSNGTIGDLVFESDWLAPKVSTGPFVPARSGWDDLQIYDATPGFSNPVQDLASYPITTTTIELGSTLETTVDFSNLPEPFLPKPKPSLHTVRGSLELRWDAPANAFYLIEQSTDLLRWSIVDVREGNDLQLSFASAVDPATGAPPPKVFYRMSAVPQ